MSHIEEIILVLFASDECYLKEITLALFVSDEWMILKK